MQLPCSAKPLPVELWTGVTSALIINQKIFQAEVEAAALTRAGFRHDQFLDDAKDQPQPAHAIALDGQCFDLPCNRAVSDELVFGSVNGDGVALDLVARLGEGERGIFLRL